LVGERKTVSEVVETVMRDQPFYETSGGGVTLSGGEPLMQLDFAYAILSECKGLGLHTAIETAANVSWSRLSRILPVTDLVMMDIKLMDSDQHQACTGVPNRRILENGRRLGEQQVPLIVRTPVIPGVNDTDAEIAAIATFVSEFENLVYYELLPFHPMAGGKYESLDIAYEARGLDSPSEEQMDHLVEVAAQCGIQVRHG
jgi:pyruvate formate lyase activating enzyme